jgi:hypothetical protein
MDGQTSEDTYYRFHIHRHTTARSSTRSEELATQNVWKSKSKQAVKTLRKTNKKTPKQDKNNFMKFMHGVKIAARMFTFL